MYPKHMKKVIACGTYLYTMVRDEVPTYLITFQGANTLFDRILVSCYGIFQDFEKQVKRSKPTFSAIQNSI